VYPDGDCLIKAIIKQLNDQSITVSAVRQQISNHIIENIHHYNGFIRVEQNVLEEEKIRLITANARKLDENGHWESEYADFVPLCLANIFKRSIRIFSSRLFTPVFDIEPDLSQPQNDVPFLLAHLATHGSEHYDAVRKLSQAEVISNTPEKNKRKDKQRTPIKEAATVNFPTPHKSAKYVSPPRRNLYRKRRSNPEEWKSSKRKTLRASGQKYISKQGKVVPERSVKGKDCNKCRFKCSQKVSKEERQNIFSLYWKLGDYDKQRSFICTNVTVAETKRCNVDKKRRSKALSYYFTINNVRQRVCKNFFLKTLDIGKKTIDSAMNKVQHGIYIGHDKRGRKTSGNKTPKADEQFLHDHIKSCPVVERYQPKILSTRTQHKKDV